MNRKSEAFNRYLELAISQGWSDPIAFANRRMDELEMEAARAAGIPTPKGGSEGLPIPASQDPLKRLY